MITDTGFMTAALGLARRGLGRVMPNPAVGCILARDGVIVGRGWTQPGGRPHAETEALARAGDRAAGATAYVTLEPCAHHGHTPPCAEALIRARIRRCVIAIEDPDPRVAGRGRAALNAAGIAVEIGICATEAAALNAGFLNRIRIGRPLVTLKLATSLDGRIATRLGESRWITGPAARRAAHLLRREHDAIMVGSGTVLADDPELTVRLAGLQAPDPIRIIADARLRTPPTARLLGGTLQAPTIIVTSADPDPARVAALSRDGVEFLATPYGHSGSLDLAAALQSLGTRGITRVLIEGGATLAAAMLESRLVDRIAWFRGPGIIGGDGLAAIQPFGGGRLADQIRGMLRDRIAVGQDLLETYALAP